jgi:hypothetical protein
MKIAKKVLMLLALLSLLQAFPIPSVLAYVSGPTQSGSIWDAAGHLVANYATLMRYDASGGTDNDRLFFPAVESHTDKNAIPPYFLNALKITVSGTKPDGSAISGIEFGDQAWLDSPHDSGASWYDVLSVLKDVIINLAPLGASELLKYGWKSPESKWDYNETATWAEWHWNLVPAAAVFDKGLQFKFSLHCDPDLQGIYTLKIQYYIDIWRYTPQGYYIRWAEKYIYETATYYFGSPKLSISASSGGTTSPAPGTYTYNYGSSVTVTASAYSGYYFSYWSLDGTAYYNNPITVTMTADHSLTAYFYYSSGGGGGGCVLYNTRILMADGKEMPVQAVKPGDEVMGYDVQSGAFVTETVTSNEHTIVDEILSINDGLLRVTPTDQPIYTDHGWVKNPQDLVIGWRIYDPIRNSWITIQSLETLNGHFNVYDLRATRPDTFIGNGILLDRKAVMC